MSSKTSFDGEPKNINLETSFYNESKNIFL